MSYPSSSLILFSKSKRFSPALNECISWKCLLYSIDKPLERIYSFVNFLIKLNSLALSWALISSFYLLNFTIMWYNDHLMFVICTQLEISSMVVENWHVLISRAGHVSKQIVVCAGACILFSFTCAVQACYLVSLLEIYLIKSRLFPCTHSKKKRKLKLNNVCKKYI